MSTATYNLNALPPGAMIQEYRVARVLGAGSFGIIYLAENTYLPETVAIKEFLPSDLVQRTEGSTVAPKSSEAEETYRWALDKFLKEARILWELGHPHRHPNIVGVKRFHEGNGTAYMVMDFEEGEPLADRLERDGTLAEDTLRGITAALLDGLELAHEHAILHRDIKPANILIRPDGSPVLIDFGAARQEMGGQVASMLVMFTPDYAAPEQVYAKGNMGPWTDIYGLGATLYRAVMGKPPLNASQRVLEPDKHVPAAQGAGKEYTPAFLQAIDAAIELTPEKRPQSVREWRKMFEKATSRPAFVPGDETVLRPPPGASPSSPEGPPQEPAHAAPPTSEPPAPRARPEAPAQGRRPWTIPIAASVLVAALAAIVLWPIGPSEPPQPQPPQPPPPEQRASEEPQPPPEPLPPEPQVKPSPEVLPSKPPELEALRKEAEQALAEYSTCGRLALTVTDDWRLMVSGHLRNPLEPGLLRQALLGIDGVRDATLDVGVHSDPLCNTLEVLDRWTNQRGPVDATPYIRTDKANRQYAEGELLVLTATSTLAFRGFLYVDYVDGAGNVLHLLPAPHKPDNELEPGDEVVLGKDRKYEIAPPHGESVLIAIASPTPLFDRARPEFESLEDYLPALENALFGAAGIEALSGYTFITTRGHTSRTTIRPSDDT